jgi:hypothetical protein
MELAEAAQELDEDLAGTKELYLATLRAFEEMRFFRVRALGQSGVHPSYVTLPEDGGLSEELA